METAERIQDKDQDDVDIAKNGHSAKEMKCEVRDLTPSLDVKLKRNQAEAI
jgi:hypothetical protein